MEDNQQRHIQHTHQKKKGTAWCGEKVGSMEWAFVDVDHALYSEINGSLVEVCKKCKEEVIKVLSM